MIQSDQFGAQVPRTARGGMFPINVSIPLENAATHWMFDCFGKTGTIKQREWRSENCYRLILVQGSLVAFEICHIGWLFSPFTFKWNGARSNPCSWCISTFRLSWDDKRKRISSFIARSLNIFFLAMWDCIWLCKSYMPFWGSFYGFRPKSKGVKFCCTVPCFQARNNLKTTSYAAGRKCTLVLRQNCTNYHSNTS